MVRTGDGFEIAEMDMKLRGPGEIDGTQQSGIGFDFKIANLAKDGKILQIARDEATAIIEKDPKLLTDENKPLLQNLIKAKQVGFEWTAIS
jgi:ATP-dependent DNA helicase RecG